MPTLSSYVQDVRDDLRDSSAQFYTTAQLQRFINRARTQVAEDSACIRILIAGGSSYGSDATVGDAVVGGAIAGQSQNPLTGTNFSTIAGQERYPFNYALPILQAQNSGIKGIYDVMSVSVSWGAIRPTLDWMPWEVLQAQARSWNSNMQSWPTIFSTNGSGENGEVWMFPIPGTASEMEWLVSCSPTDLVNDSSPDAIPAPYSAAVKYYALFKCMTSTQRFGQAKEYYDEYSRKIVMAVAASDRGKVPSWYGDEVY